ncbi:MAG: ABC transporter permease [Chitinophagaceae bacterium]
MLRLFTILYHSFKMAIQELKVNKLRTFLSLFGITIGIFCIIGVLATVDSLKRKVKQDIQSFGNNTIYIDKWQYGGGGEYPWWKYFKRPTPTYDEMVFLKENSQLASNICFFASTNNDVSFDDNIIKSTNIYGISEEFNQIQTIDIVYGRYLNESDFKRGVPAVVIGYLNAENLFIYPERAVGKLVTVGGKTAYVVGVIKKQGTSLVGGFDYDQCILLPYRFYAATYEVKNSGPNIMVQSKMNVTTAALSDELRGLMRQKRRLSPTTEDDFSLNDVNLLGESINGFFAQVNLGGWAIAGLSLIVGMFGVANIMFVTVRERTSQIGLKKAIGAKKTTILAEFLIESAFLCIIGGLIGLFFVWLLSKGLSAVLPFPIFIAPEIVVIALSICVILGVVSGIIPASIAARMDPVVAIRTK